MKRKKLTQPKIVRLASSSGCAQQIQLAVTVSSRFWPLAVMDMDTDCVKMLDLPPLEVQVPDWGNHASNQPE